MSREPARLTLLSRVVTHLSRDNVPFALIGAAALAAHGVSRSTFDVDLLTTERRLLQASSWEGVDASIEIRTGDAEDPLAGVIRLAQENERDVDVVVGRFVWQTALIADARVITSRRSKRRGPSRA